MEAGVSCVASRSSSGTSVGCWPGAGNSDTGRHGGAGCRRLRADVRGFGRVICLWQVIDNCGLSVWKQALAFSTRHIYLNMSECEL
jgi:hypothetical protein